MTPMTNLILHTPTLYSVSSTGKVKEWTISVHSNPGGSATIMRRHGYMGAKIQEIEKVISEGKNIGKANETSPYEQAVSEALAMRQKRLDTGFTEALPNLSTHCVELPMLAQRFSDRKHNIKYPCYLQPKLDGVRCFAKKVDENTIVYTSRKGKEYLTLSHLTPTLLRTMDVGQILDGEVYIHGVPCQKIVSLVKKIQPESATLQYHVYDLADATMPYVDRMRRLFTMAPINTPEIVIVETTNGYNEQSVYDAHDHWVREGYEGVIVRNAAGLYKFDNRSSDLQKYKEFIDEEFKIIGGECGTGLHDGCVIFTCASVNGTPFNVYPRGSLDMRRAMYYNLSSYVGRMLTVRYQHLSEDGVPIFPIGIVVRDYE